LIRSRLSLVFALLALIAILQAGFTLWSTHAAAREAQRSVQAKALLNGYLALAADKQRLKVWYADFSLTQQAPVIERDRLLAAMSRSVETLIAQSGATGGSEAGTIKLLASNLEALRQALMSAAPARAADPAGADSASVWRSVMSSFDEAEGRDMRLVLGEAIDRQRAASAAAEQALAVQLRQIRMATIALAVCLVLLAGAALLYFVRRLQQPFAALMQTTEAIAQGDYTVQALPQRRDEFRQLTLRLNAMAARLAEVRQTEDATRSQLEAAVSARTQELTRSLSRLLNIDAQRRRFFAQVSHELRTPVTVLRGEAEIALRAREASVTDHRASLERVRDAAIALSSRVDDLVQAASAESDGLSLTRERSLIAPLIAACLAQARALAHGRGQVVEDALSGALPEAAAGWIDPERIGQALMVLLDNALRYSPAGGTVQLTGRLRTVDSAAIESSAADAQALLCIEVTDSGIGTEASERERLFEPHFRGAQARQVRPEGVGLGLSIAQAIVQAHGGELSLGPRPDGAPGSLARMVLPMSAEPARHNIHDEPADR
jgi:two-component system, OmpR family, sensor kinase